MTTPEMMIETTSYQLGPYIYADLAPKNREGGTIWKEAKTVEDFMRLIDEKDSVKVYRQNIETGEWEATYLKTDKIVFVEPANKEDRDTVNPDE